MPTTNPTEPTYRLVPPSAALRPPPVLDERQRRVVDHAGGPLLVLAGPGTGKTTTLVEAIVDRVEQRGASPDSVLALTFSRKAAEQLRDRVTARLGRTVASPAAATFHSFAYGLMRAYTPRELYDAPLRLLSAPEQDVVLAELLSDAPESVRWPEALRRAIGTRGFAEEVRAVLARAQEKGLGYDALAALGRDHDAPELEAAAAFMRQYDVVLNDENAIDYSGLIAQSVALLQDPSQPARDELRARFSHVFVDEYQDTDPGQVALLRALAGDGRNLTVVGDPHQSIYGFRGAEVRGILEFPTAFPHADGRPADVVALRTTRRFGPRLLLATQRIASRLGLPGTIDAVARDDFAAPVAVSAHGDGRVEVLTFDTERAEAEHLSDLLRRAHLEDDVPWSEMAVLVRSGQATIPALRRALGAAGVPVEVAADDLPLVRDPAVRPLLEALRTVVNLDNDDPTHVDHVDAARLGALLTGPLGGLDAGELRRLSQALRRREKQAAIEESRGPRHSSDLLRDLLERPALLDAIDLPEARRARSLLDLVHRTRADLEAGANPEELLWTLWAGTDWSRRLRRGIDAGGAAARRAHRDLDAICALFDAAARAEERRDHLGVRAFLATLVAQRIPGDTLAERGHRGGAVRLLTAHRAKGLEWRLVVVAHVQEDGWPDLRHRATLLRADRIGRGELVPPVTPREMLREERRLFYVACTRARERLVVTAVASAEDDGEQPSRFLAELGVTLQPRRGRPERPLSLPGLVAELRRVVADPDTSEPLREAAARRLARLAGETVRGHQVAPQADPASWWGTRARSLAEAPLRAADQPVPVSATVLDSLMVCPTQWFLAREAGGVSAAHQAANLGQLVHALADRVARGELPAGVDDVDLLMEHVDRVWDRLQFRTPWAKAREHERIRAALSRFLAWHHGNGREVLGTETPFRAVVELPDGEQVRLSGYADRLELDSHGRVVVVDLKTGRSAPSDKAVLTHRQLALYQYAVDHGALDELEGADLVGLRAGGAELVQLGSPDPGPAKVQSQPVHPADGAEREQLRSDLGRAVAMLRDEAFPAVPGQHCRDCAFVPVCPAKSAGAVIQL